MTYYDITNILKTNAQYNLIIGQRSNGKTYALLKYAIENYIVNNSKTVYIRRYKEDIKSNRMNDLFNGLIYNDDIYKLTDYKYNSVKFYRNRFYLGNALDDKIECDTNNFISVIALNEFEHDKSRDFTNYNLIVFDEFLSRRYLSDEFSIFLNSVSTIFRNNDNGRIFLLGNTISFISPYFTELGINDITKLEKCKIYTYKINNTQISLEYCGDKKSIISNSKLFGFSQYSKMILKGDWDISPYKKLLEKYDKDDILYTFSVFYNQYKLQGQIIYKNDLFIYLHKKTSEIKNEICYTNNNILGVNYRSNFLYKKDKLDLIICNCLIQNKIYYQDSIIGELFHNFINESRYNIKGVKQ